MSTPSWVKRTVREKQATSSETGSVDSPSKVIASTMSFEFKKPIIEALKASLFGFGISTASEVLHRMCENEDVDAIAVCVMSLRNVRDNVEKGYSNLAVEYPELAIVGRPDVQGNINLGAVRMIGDLCVAVCKDQAFWSDFITRVGNQTLRSRGQGLSEEASKIQDDQFRSHYGPALSESYVKDPQYVKQVMAALSRALQD